VSLRTRREGAAIVAKTR